VSGKRHGFLIFGDWKADPWATALSLKARRIVEARLPTRQTLGRPQFAGNDELGQKSTVL